MAITQVFLDNFTEGSDTLLSAHTPDTGISWLPLGFNGGTNANVLASENSLNQPFYSPSAESDYIINVSDSQSDDQIVAQTLGGGVIGRILLQGQDGTTGNNGYRLTIISTTITLIRVTDGATTTLDAVNGAGLVDTDIVEATITASGDISVKINGTPKNWNTAGGPIVNDTTHTGGWPGWTGRKSYTSGGITKFEASIDTGAGVTTSVTTGTAIPTQTEADIVTGGKTIILTLTGDTFVTGTSSLDGIAAGSDSDITASGTNWDSLIKTALDNNDVVLSVGDTVATITLPAFATYDVPGTETITWTIPAASLTTSAIDVVSSPTFTVTHIAVVPSITTEPLKNNTGQLLTSESGVKADVYDTTDGTLVVRKTALTSDGTTAVVTFTDAAMSATTEYRVVIELSGGEEGIARITTA